MGRADPRRGQDRSPTISVSLTTANSPQTVTSGEGQAAGARCWRLTCSRTLPGAKAIVFCKRWCGTSGRCPLLRGACSPQAACRAPETSVTSARALCRSLQTARVPRGQGGAPSPNLPRRSPRAPICSPRLRTAAKRRRQTAGAPGSRSVLQSVSCKSLLTAEIGAGLRTSRRLRSAGFQPPGRIWGQAAHPWVGDALEDVAALIGRGLPFCGRTWRPVPSRASPGAPGVGVTGVTEAPFPSPS